MNELTRRGFVGGVLGSGAALWVAQQALGASGPADVYREIVRRHEESVARLQEWIRQRSIAAENIGMEEGCALMVRLAKDAGFQYAERVGTTGHPGVYATLDAGARRTLGLYFMYDVKQVDESEWSTPPWEGRVVDNPGFGRILQGRGAVNQKGPQAAFLAALHAIHGAGRKCPVNLVLVAEGEEEIGSPSFPQVVHASRPRDALSRSLGIFMPDASQELDGSVTVTLGSKGDVELDVIVSGEKWGRGPVRDVHSSRAANVDAPAWHLIQGLNSLVTANGDPAVDGFFDLVRPLSAAEREMVEVAARRLDESSAMREAGVTRWARDATWRQALEDYFSRPTLTIEGLVGGYTGPGGKTILPTRLTAKLDIRLVPDMTPEDTIAKVRAHLARRGFGDLEVKVNGGVNYTSSTALESSLIQSQLAVYRHYGIDPLVLPRSGGSWPGSVFTDAPLELAAGHFGLGYGQGAHAKDEFILIESTNPKLHGYDDLVRSYVDFLYAIA
jgi:acetylornithine deacetylase/succinyl-diaminopimelate desuccinylase-like protein